MIDQIQADLFKEDSNWNVVLFRLLNLIGAHPSGFIKKTGTSDCACSGQRGMLFQRIGPVVVIFN